MGRTRPGARSGSGRGRCRRHAAEIALFRAAAVRAASLPAPARPPR